MKNPLYVFFPDVEVAKASQALFCYSLCLLPCFFWLRLSGKTRTMKWEEKKLKHSEKNRTRCDTEAKKCTERKGEQSSRNHK